MTWYSHNNLSRQTCDSLHVNLCRRSLTTPNLLSQQQEKNVACHQSCSQYWKIWWGKLQREKEKVSLGHLRTVGKPAVCRWHLAAVPWLQSQGKKAKKLLRLLQYWPVLHTSGYQNMEWRVGEMYGVFIWRGRSDLVECHFNVHIYTHTHTHTHTHTAVLSQGAES